MSETNQHESGAVDISTILNRDAAIEFLATIHDRAHLSRAWLPKTRAADLHTLISERKALTKIDSRFFEELVAELLRADGFEEVTLVPRHNAPGPDIIAMCTNPLGHRQQVLVEIKRWKDAVGVEVVRETMYKVDTEYRATSALIVTTSHFTQAALEELQRFHVWRLALRDGAEVQEWIRRHAAKIAPRGIPTESTQTIGSLLDVLRKGWGNRPISVYLRDCASACSTCAGNQLCAQVILEYSIDVYDYAYSICLGCHQASAWEASPLLRYGKPGQCELCGVIRHHGCVFQIL